MERDIDRVLIPQRRIAERVAELARQIVADPPPGGRGTRGPTRAAVERDIDRVLIPQRRIAERVAELARQIVADHTPGGEVTIVPILTGAMIVCADLIRPIPLPLPLAPLP